MTGASLAAGRWAASSAARWARLAAFLASYSALLPIRFFLPGRPSGLPIGGPQAGYRGHARARSRRHSPGSSASLQRLRNNTMNGAVPDMQLSYRVTAWPKLFITFTMCPDGRLPKSEPAYPLFSAYFLAIK